jgi:SAM-dependent methyltransferase
MESAYWDQRYASQDLVWTADANRFLMDETAGLAPGCALDLASGEGRNAMWLAQQGWNVRAVDFSGVATEKGRQIASARHIDERIEFETADLRRYEPGLQCFDLVVMVYLHIPQLELQPIIARAAQAVAPGGTLLLIGHDSENLVRGFGGPQTAEMLYTADQVVAALGGTLVIDKAQRVERAIATQDGQRIALDCLVRAHKPPR